MAPGLARVPGSGSRCLLSFLPALFFSVSSVKGEAHLELGFALLAHVKARPRARHGVLGLHVLPFCASSSLVVMGASTLA